MATERTPLTQQIPHGPSYVFPGVPSRVRRQQIKRFQCCVCSLFLSVLFIAFILTITLTIPQQDAEEIPIVLSTENSNITPKDSTTLAGNLPLNGTEILNILLSLQQPLNDESVNKWKLPKPSANDSKEAINMGIRALAERELLEEDLVPPDRNTPTFRHQKSVATIPEGRKASRRGFIEENATKFIAKKYNYTKLQGRTNIGKGSQLNVLIRYNVKCDFNSKYRTSNGTCNNKKYYRTYGAAMIPFKRSLAPDYGDGISSPRVSNTNGKLPSARQISIQVHRPSYSIDPKFTIMLAVWGQFLDHDITATALSQGVDGEAIDCCLARKTLHPECYPVFIDSGDPFYEQLNLTCMNFIRSAPAPTGHFGPREQLNQATAFIDGSVVYGSSDEKQQLLRTGTNGTLEMLILPNGSTLLPISNDPNDGCNEKEMNTKGKYCFTSGDPRANENLYLTCMHLILARHHNFLAKGLQKINSHWNDETIFQEARKILGAQMQHITYNEFLPILFGGKLAKTKNLLSNPLDKQDHYNSTMDPSIRNSFASAAFRFAHTLIPGLLRSTRNKSVPQVIELHKLLFNPYSLWTSQGLENAMGVVLSNSLAKSDPYFTTELTQKLFEKNNRENNTACPPGLDLVSLNIQRGRDHGLPAYYEWRKHCQLPEADTWEKLSYAVDPFTFQALKKVYNDAKDVDLYTGALGEPPLPGALIGPLLSCLISDQFIRLKFGDSFWYERKNGPQRFSKQQLQEIYKTTLAGIICQNSEGVIEAQKFVMQEPNNDTNPITKCKVLNKFNFDLWSTSKTVTTLTHVKLPETSSVLKIFTDESNSSLKKSIIL